MTKSELSQCYWLNREIDKLTEELENLDGYTSVKLTGMPRGGGVSDPTGNLVVRKAEIHRLISLKLEECMIARARIERFINSVEDSEMRMILRLRHINGLSWQQIAFSINQDGKYSNDESVPRKKYNRFMEGQNGI